MAEELWYILTVNSTSSCWPALDVSSSAVPGTVKLPSLELSIRKPSAWIAARWAPPGDEGHRVAGPGQQAAKVATHTAGAHNSYLHDTDLSFAKMTRQKRLARERVA